MNQRLNRINKMTLAVVVLAVLFLVGIPLAGAGDDQSAIGVQFVSPEGATYMVQYSYSATISRYDPGEALVPTNGCGCAGAPIYPNARNWTERQMRDTTITRTVPFHFSCYPGTQLRLSITTEDQRHIYGLMDVSSDPSGYNKFQDYQQEAITSDMVNSVLSGTVQTIWLKNPNGQQVVTIVLGSKRPW